MAETHMSVKDRRFDGSVNLIRGDSFTVLPAMPDKCVDAIITDPPYDLSQQEQRVLHREFERISRGDILIFCSPENQWAVHPTRWLFWVKPTSTKNYSRSYGRFVEMIALYKRSDVWGVRFWANHTGLFTDTLVKHRIHPHQKPISLMERLILNHTEPNATVLDPFVGSGTTLQACERTGRCGIGIEIIPPPTGAPP